MGNSMDKILPGLYVGNIRGSTNRKILDSNKITHILSIFDRANPVIEDRVYLCIKANDVAAQDLTQYFSQCNDFIHNARVNKGNVLVHCVAGMSRSVTVTTAYIMTITNLSWREALNAIRGARRSANPNFGFQRQLLAFYHDHLSKEKERFNALFPPSPFPDQQECERLLEAHRQWVLHGDEEKDDSETTYPLPHNAYKSDQTDNGEPNSKLSTNKTSAEIKLTSTCTLCSSVFPDQAQGATCGGEETLCEKCAKSEQETLNLIQAAPDVRRFDSPFKTNIDEASCSTFTMSQNDIQMETDCSDSLVDTLFSGNSRKKGKEVSFNEQIQISKVENIDSKMSENSKIVLPENAKGAPTHDVEAMRNDVKIDKPESMEAEINPDALVDHLFNSGNKAKVNKL